MYFSVSNICAGKVSLYSDILALPVLFSNIWERKLVQPGLYKGLTFSLSELRTLLFYEISQKRSVQYEYSTYKHVAYIHVQRIKNGW